MFIYSKNNLQNFKYAIELPFLNTYQSKQKRLKIFPDETVPTISEWGAALYKERRLSVQRRRSRAPVAVEALWGVFRRR